MALIAHLDAFAHHEDDLDAVIHEACRAAADSIGAGFAGVLQYRADEDTFVLQAGFGWPAQMIGRMRVAADLGTTAGVAWLTGQVVQFRRLDGIECIWLPEPLIGDGVRRTVSVPIRGDSRRAFGVLEVGSVEAGEFTRQDLSFLQAMADGVAAAVSLHASRASRMELAELVMERQIAPTRRLSTGSGRQSQGARTSYQQDAQVGAG